MLAAEQCREQPARRGFRFLLGFCKYFIAVGKAGYDFHVISVAHARFDGNLRKFAILALHPDERLIGFIKADRIGLQNHHIRRFLLRDGNGYLHSGINAVVHRHIGDRRIIGHRTAGRGYVIDRSDFRFERPFQRGYGYGAALPHANFSDIVFIDAQRDLHIGKIRDLNQIRAGGNLIALGDADRIYPPIEIGADGFAVGQAHQLIARLHRIAFGNVDRSNRSRCGRGIGFAVHQI